MTTSAEAASLGGILSGSPGCRGGGALAAGLSRVVSEALPGGVPGDLAEAREQIVSRSTVNAEREHRFEALVSEHRDRAIGLAWRLLGGDGAAAEDVAQEAFLRAYRGLARFREDAQLSTWFYRILVNEVQRHRRWRWVRERVAGEMPEEPHDPSPRAQSDPAMRDRVARALDGLPRGQREAFVLVHLEGLTIRETAELTGRAMGTVKSHLHRALRALRRELADLGDLVGAGRAAGAGTWRESSASATPGEDES
jgi:RNA polymerase sigma-70 factor (ECF subfamily)